MISQIDNLVKLKHKSLFNESSDVLEDIKEYITNFNKVQNCINTKISKRDVYDKFIIDRFEGKYAICEAGKEIFSVKKEYLPINAKEGNIIKLINDKYVIDVKVNEKRHVKIKNVTEDLWSN